MPLLALALAILGSGFRQDPPSDEKVRALVERLGAMYETERAEARKALEAVGARALKHLLAGLEHADHRVRRGCLDLLAIVDSPSGVDRACALFRSKDEERGVQAAAFTYVKRHAAKAEDFFIEALDNVEDAYRLSAVETLVTLRSTKGLDRAAALFDKEAVKEIKLKIFELLEAGGEPARPHLLKLMGNPEAAVRQQAINALISSGAPPDDLVEPAAKMLKMEVTSGILEAAFDVFSRAGEKAVPHLIEGLKSASENVRRKALDAVKKERTPAVLDGVADLYHREAVEGLRSIALEYLIEQGLRAEPAFIKALESPLAKVRMEAIPALGKIRSEKVYDRVAALYREEKNAEVRQKCFEYLESVGPRAEPELIIALKDDDLVLRRRAIRALGRAGSEKAIGPMSELLSEPNPATRAEAIEALAWIGAKAVEFLREGVKANRVAEADAAEVGALCDQIAVERVLDGMITENGTTGTWPGQFEALAKSGKERYLPALWKIATDAEYAIRARDPDRVPLRYREYLQCLALLAIGEFGDAAWLKQLQGLTFTAGEDRHREQLIALHRLGDKGPLDRFVASELKEGRTLMTGENRLEGYRKLFNAALLQARAGLREEALKAYGELTGAVESAKHQQDFPDVATAYYNTGCLHAQAGRKAEAVAAVARAVEAGFRDFDWILRDRELDPIRGEEEFKKLIPEPESQRKK